MRRIALLVIAALLAGLLADCATIPRYTAANDVHALLVAIRDGDQRAFDAHIDRAALKTNLRARVLAEMSRDHSALGGLGALLAGPLLDAAVDAALRPEVFRLVARQYGYEPAQPLPSTLAIAQYVRALDGDRACVVTRAKGPCVFLLKNEDGTWRLIDFQGHIDLDGRGRVKLTE